MIINASKKRIVNTEFPIESKFDLLPNENTNQGISAFVSIQEGCDRFCTFCVVPYTRGSEYSRNVNDIIEESKKLVDRGAIEITLLGQNVNAFHGDGLNGKAWGLGKLIQEVSKIKGLERIRYTTSHPRDMDDELIETHSLEKLMPFLHLPVQSGSDKILKAMNRKHTRDLYFETIKKLRKVRANLAFSSDFIIGFPGETDKDFEDTMDMVRQVEFASCYSFKFSARPGTPAANIQNIVHESIATERLMRLQKLINEQQRNFNTKSIGLTLPVLFDRKGKKSGQIVGRSPFNQSVYVNGNEQLINNLVNVKITEGFDNSLTGEIIVK